MTIFYDDDALADEMHLLISVWRDTKPIVLRMVYQVAKQVKIPIIGVGGVTKAAVTIPGRAVDTARHPKTTK